MVSEAGDRPNNVVLLGDSIFDNGVYVPGEPDVVRQLRMYLPKDWRATLLAVDGNVVDSVHDQLSRIPADATHLVLSVGGNDALGHIEIIDQRVSSARETLDRLSSIRESFTLRYRRLVNAILSRGVPTAVCTIYEGNLEPDIRRAASVALTVFNDAILRIAFEAGVPVIDLRLVCRSADCYANPIEPSAIGGDRIARTIADLVTGDRLEIGRTVIYGAES
jgi:lysophospholipase L1-like esterase